MFGLGFQEILLIVLVILLFYGGKKVPEMMRGLGQGVKSFRDGMNGREDPKGSGEKTATETERNTTATDNAADGDKK